MINELLMQSTGSLFDQWRIGCQLATIIPTASKDLSRRNPRDSAIFPSFPVAAGWLPIGNQHAIVRTGITPGRAAASILRQKFVNEYLTQDTRAHQGA